MNVLVYALHNDGAINKNSLGAVSAAAKAASDLGGEAHAVLVGGDDLTDELLGTLGAYGATKVYRVKGPEGLAQPVVDAMGTLMNDHGYDYAVFGGGLLGFEIGAGLAARVGGRRDDGGHGQSRSRTASSSRSARSSATPRSRPRATRARGSSSGA